MKAMWKRLGETGRRGWRGALAAALLLGWLHGAERVPEPELRLHFDVALLVGGTGFAVAMIR